MTRDALTRETPAVQTPVTVCGHPTGAPVAIRQIHRTSGAGFTLYACPGCAPRYSPGAQWDELPVMRR
ncbi:hypothetical protein AB0G73_37930 [Streptomyces sp. NPDC020719]|uniref:hypothetical protein n=1 Tax=Streptomyces sp. NPDC020719 TaxID=3154896 RepID=UPI0033C6EA04